MDSLLAKLLRLMKMLAIVGAIALGVLLWRQLEQARKINRLTSERLAKSWPLDGPASPGLRGRLEIVRQRASADDRAGVIAALEPVERLSEPRELVVHRFFEQHPTLRDRLVRLVKAAEDEERQQGAEATFVRDAVSRALLAAAEERPEWIGQELTHGETLLARLVAGEMTASSIAAGAPEGLAGLLQSITPRFELGRDLLTETHVPVERLLRRARAAVDRGDYIQAARHARLAAALLSVTPIEPTNATTPAWFDRLDPFEPADVSPARATAAVELAEAVGAAESSDGPIGRLLKTARRHQASDASSEAHWWAVTALTALGMTESDVAAVTSRS